MRRAHGLYGIAVSPRAGKLVRAMAVCTQTIARLRYMGDGSDLRGVFRFCSAGTEWRRGEACG